MHILPCISYIYVLSKSLSLAIPTPTWGNLQFQLSACAVLNAFFSFAFAAVVMTIIT